MNTTSTKTEAHLLKLVLTHAFDLRDTLAQDDVFFAENSMNREQFLLDQEQNIAALARFNVSRIMSYLSALMSDVFNDALVDCTDADNDYTISLEHQICTLLSELQLDHLR